MPISKSQMFPVQLVLGIVCVVNVHLTSSEVPFDHREFLWQILEKYGQNSSIPIEGFERLYKNLGLGRTSLKVESLNQTSNSSSVGQTFHSRSSRDVQNLNTTGIFGKELSELFSKHNEVPRPPDYSSPHLLKSCLSVQEVLRVYDLPQSDTIRPVSFLHLCPAILYQLDQGVCVTRMEDQSSTRTSPDSWLYAGLSWLVISVSGMIIVILVPLLQKTFLNKLIGFLVALAIGTLLGDAFLHLIPHALMEGPHHEHEGDSHNHTGSVKKTGLMFLTVVFFFLLESVLNTTRARKDSQKAKETKNYVSVDVNESEREMMELSKASKPEHPHSHSHGGGNGNQSNTALMVIMGDGLHNLTDGLAIGAAFTGGLAPGFATAVAVFTHELPHELGDFAVLLQSGVTVRKALFFNMVSSALSLLGTVIGLFIGNFGDTTKYVYAITAGCFTYIALSNLVPEVTRQNNEWHMVILRLCGVLSGGLLMAGIAVYEDDLQNLF